MSESGYAQRTMAGPDEGWLLSSNDRDPWLRGYLGNGRLAMQLVAGGALASPHGAPLHLMAQLYDRAAEREVEHPAPLPSWSGLHLSFDGHLLRPDDAHGYQQILDLRRGLAVTRHNWTTADGAMIAVKGTQAVLRQEPNLAMVTLSVAADRPGTLDVSGQFTTSPIDALREVAEEGRDQTILFTARTLQRGIPVSLAAGFAPNPAQQVRAEGFILHLATALAAGETTTITWLVAAHSGYTAEDPTHAALAELGRARTSGPEALLEGHLAAWSDLWRADIVVEGDPEVQRFVRAGLFGLLSSTRADVPASIAPMGLSSLGYNGHIFWDADTWMYPSLLLLHPDLARGMLTYRQERLGVARERAMAEGYQGAMFPWESATDGSETTPSYARTGLKEHHITACVAIAHWQYYLATGNRDWLRDDAWPVLEAAATFWVSRVTPNGAGGYEIHDVICADEYAEDVDNNAFTNAAARAALLAAVVAAEALGHPAPAEWAAVAAGLVLPSDGDLVLEYDGYDGRTIKQADVELLTYPLEHPLSAQTIRTNLDTYQRATDPLGPAMGRCISSIVAAQLGRRDDALALFRACYGPHLFGPFYTLAETPENGAVNFLTGVGGALQALLFGFAGLRIHDGALAVDPLLPSAWQALRFPALQWRGGSISLAILPGDLAVIGFAEGIELTLQRWRPGDSPLVVESRGLEGMECTLRAEGWRVEPRFGAAISWWLYPPPGGPSHPFVRVALTGHAPDGRRIALSLEQRVQDGDT